MPLYLALTFDRVFLRTGPARRGFPLAGQFRPAKPFDRLPQFGALVYWPKAVDWVRVTAEVTVEPSAAATTFAATPTGLDAVCERHGVRRDQLAPPKFLEANSFLTTTLPRDNRVVLTVEVDTDSAGFLQAVRDRRNAEREELIQTLQVMFFDAKEYGSLFTEQGKVDVALKPCRPLPRFPGVLAIDLGNTTTAAASLSENDPVYQTAAVRLVPLDPPPAELAVDADPVPSVIRLDRIESPVTTPPGVRRFPSLPEDDRPTAVTAVVGRLATAGSGGDLPEGVVYGAKQLLTMKEPDLFTAPLEGRGTQPDPYLTLVIPHVRAGGPPQAEKVEVMNRLPGELLFAHTVRRFREAATHWPGDLVLTYPTTYSPRELRQLTQAAARGWLRATSQPQGLGVVADPTGDAEFDELARRVRDELADTTREVGRDGGLIGLALDEATAAAFYHLYRRVFERPGGLLRFRYLHPNGLRLLLIDCGGGTTDVALVEATSPSDRRLDVDVLARTGVRAFGGDHITREVARVLKAKIAVLAGRVTGGTSIPPGVQLPASGPPQPEQAKKVVEEFLAKIRAADPDDTLVPTRFDPRDVGPAAHQRRAAAHALWRLAEQVKRKLADGKAVKVREADPAAARKETSALVAAVAAALPPAAQSQVATQIGEASVARWEVDALVRGSLDAVMTKCNRLISRHLTGGGRPDREVDWVVISGNGARYPLVRESAESGLHVAYLADRIEFDPQNLKDAVAKGAVMARMVERVPRSVGVRFNRHLSELLPFDVGYHDLVSNETELLFREYTPYTALADTPKRVRLIAGTAGGLGNTFIIGRRFPGDDRFAPYASFRFDQGIQGELEVRYDAARGEFAVTDTTNGAEGAFTDLTDPKEHISPVLRGDV